MNADQENSVSSFLAVDGVFRKYETVWTPVVAFLAGVNTFRTGLTNINTFITAQSASTLGVTEAKRLARVAMVEVALKVAGGVHAYAFDQGDSELQARVDYSESDLLRFRDSIVGPVCQGIHDEASAIDDIVDYGVPAAMLADLQTKVTAYTGNVPQPRMATGKRKAATMSLEDEIAAARAVLDKKIDRLVEGFKASQPEFFKEYAAARIVVDAPGGHKANGNGDGHDTPPPAH